MRHDSDLFLTIHALTGYNGSKTQSRCFQHSGDHLELLQYGIIRRTVDADERNGLCAGHVTTPLHGGDVDAILAKHGAYFSYDARYIFVLQCDDMRGRFEIHPVAKEIHNSDAVLRKHRSGDIQSAVLPDKTDRNEVCIFVKMAGAALHAVSYTHLRAHETRHDL